MKLNSKSIGAIAGVLAILSMAGFASAQTSNTVNVSTTGTSNVPTAGTTATLGTITLSGTNGGAYIISSIPISVTVSNGGSTSDLSNCQLLNNGTALNTGTNIPTVQSGSNTFTFDTPFSIPANTNETLTLQCAISSSSPTNAMYQFTAATPIISSVTGTTTGIGSLGVMLSPVTSVKAGTQNAVLALLTLDASNSNQNVSVSSIPVTLSFTGAAASDYSNCALRSPTSLTTALNTGVNAVGTASNGINTFTFDTPISIPAGSAEILALTCDISSSATPGSTVVVSVIPSTVMASGVSSGSFDPSSEMTSTGAAAQTSGTIEITAPNTTTTTTTTGTTTTTPGTPNTGAGGNAPFNFLVLAVSALAVAGGAGFLLKRQTQ